MPQPASRTRRPAAAAPAPAPLTAERLLEMIVGVARDKRAEDVVALDVRGLADYMDYLVLATGRSVRQNQAIADGILRALKPLKVRPLVRPGPEDGAWICLDFVDVVFHVFDGATRAHYDLELLWGDAQPVNLPEPARKPPAATDDDASAED
jgi:ribosome-associated protein